MIRIRIEGKKNSEKIVTQKQYNNIFKKFGYVVVEEDEKNNVKHFDEETKSDEKHEDNVEQHEDNVEQDEQDELEKIPISDMNKNQLMEFSKKHKIDTSGATNVADARKIIQRTLRERKM